MRLFSVALILLVISCTGNSSKDEIHPIKERYPYQNESVEEVSISRKLDDSSEQLIIPGKSILETRAFASVMDITEIDSVIEPEANLYMAQFESIAKDRVVFLDTFQNLLYEYNLSTQKWRLLAEQGRGPGELLFVKDISVVGRDLYVTSGDSRISQFDCSNSPCVFRKEISLKGINPTSVAITNDELIVMGNLSKYSFSGSVSDSVIINSLFEVDRKGSVLKKFGRFYDVKTHWMLLQPFSSGKIRYSNEVDHHLMQYFDLIPYLYLFEDGTLTKKFHFSGFNVAKRRFVPTTQELFVSFEDWSLIQDVTKVADNNLMVTIRHYGNRRVTDLGLKWDESKDFYLINISENKSHYLGQSFVESENIWVTNRHLIKQKDGKLFFNTYKIKLK